MAIREKKEWREGGKRKSTKKVFNGVLYKVYLATTWRIDKNPVFAL